MSGTTERVGGWDPVAGHDPERGETYCSPRCGGRCRKSDYDFVVASSLELARQMGDGWDTHVWENLGWHYRVFKGVAAIHPNYRHTLTVRNTLTGYTCFFNSTKQVVETANTPAGALEECLRKHRVYTRKSQDDLEVFDG